MAKKNQRKSRQEATQRKKQQRRLARTERKPTQTLRPVGKLGGLTNLELIEEVTPLLRKSPVEAGVPTDYMEHILRAAWSTDDLLSQPEFADIAFSPLDTVQSYVEIGIAMGVAPTASRTRLTKEENDRLQKTFDATVERVLTEDIRGQFIQALTALRKRLRQQRKPKDLARAAAAQMLLEMTEYPALAIGAGVVRKSVVQCLEAGFEIAGGLTQLGEADEISQLPPDEMLQIARKSGIIKKMEGLLEKIPGLQHFAEKQVQKIREEGEQAVFAGELVLNVYSQAELRQAHAILETFYPEEDDDSYTFRMLLEKHGKELVEKWIIYIQALFTPERVRQLHDSLVRMTQHPLHTQSKWGAYLLLLRETFADGDAGQYEVRLLSFALMAELTLMEMEDDEEADGEDKDTID